MGRIYGLPKMHKPNTENDKLKLRQINTLPSILFVLRAQLVF